MGKVSIRLNFFRDKFFEFISSSTMDSSFGQIIARIKQASNDIVEKRNRLEKSKAQCRQIDYAIEAEKLRKINIEETLRKSKIELIEVKAHQTVNKLASLPAIVKVVEDQEHELQSLEKKIEHAKMKVVNVRKDCFDFNSSFMEEGRKREQMALKDIMENTVAYEKELEVLKSRKEEFAKIDTKLKKYETSITKTTKLNDLMKEKISDMTQDIYELQTELQRWKNNYAKAQDQLRNIDFKLNSIARNQQNFSMEDQNYSTKMKAETTSGNDFVPASSLLDGKRKFKFRKIK